MLTAFVFTSERLDEAMSELPAEQQEVIRQFFASRAAKPLQFEPVNIEVIQGGKS